MYLKRHAQHVVNHKCRIYYWHHKNRTGKNNKQTIVFHAGSTVNHTAVLGLERLFFSRGYSTIVFDQRGTGHSSIPTAFKEYSLDKYAKDIALMIDKEKIRCPHFITQSFGVMPVVHYAAKYRNTRSIISINGSYDFSKTTIHKAAYYLFQFLLRHQGLLYALSNEIKEKAFNKKMKYMDFSRTKSVGVFGKIFKDNSGLRYVNAARSAAYKNLHTNICKDLEKIDIPIINIVGSDDLLVTKKANAGFRKHSKNFKGYIMKGDHSTSLLKPKKIFDLIVKNKHL